MSFEYLDGIDFSFFGIDVDVDGRYLAYTWNVKVFPLARVISHRIDPFVYAGIGVGWAEFDAGSIGDADETAFITRFGGGIDLYVTEQLAVNASSSYVLPTGDLDDFAYVSLVFGCNIAWILLAPLRSGAPSVLPRPEAGPTPSEANLYRESPTGNHSTRGLIRGIEGARPAALGLPDRVKAPTPPVRPSIGMRGLLVEMHTLELRETACPRESTQARGARRNPDPLRCEIRALPHRRREPDRARVARWARRPRITRGECEQPRSIERRTRVVELDIVADAYVRVALRSDRADLIDEIDPRVAHSMKRDDPCSSRICSSRLASGSKSGSASFSGASSGAAPLSDSVATGEREQHDRDIRPRDRPTKPGIARRDHRHSSSSHRYPSCSSASRMALGTVTLVSAPLRSASWICISASRR